MSKKTFSRKMLMLRTNIIECFAKYKTLVCLVCVAVLFGMIVAVSTICNNADGLTINNCLDSKLIACLCRESQFSSLIFPKVFEFVFVCTILFICCFCKPLRFLLILLFGFLSFKCFFDVAIICLLFGFGGFLFCLLTILIFEFLLYFLLLLFCMLLIDNVECFREKDCFTNAIKLLVVFLIMYVACKLLQILMFSIFSPIFIIIV